MTLAVLAPSLFEPLDVEGVRYYESEVDPDADAVASTGFFVPRYLGSGPNLHLTQHMPHLEVVQLPTIGYDYALGEIPAGVWLCNAAGVHEQSTGELAIGLVVAHWRGIDRASRDMVDGRWDHRRGRSLQSAEVLVIGAGPVGRAIAECLAPLGCSVTLAGSTARAGVLGAADLPNAVPEMDVVILAVPLTPSTRGMVDATFLARMRDGALLVNVARGPVVETDALVEEVERGRLHAALDVTDPEPLPPDHPLWRSPNVLITPHVGGDSNAFPVLARRLISDQVRAWRAGRDLRNVVVQGVRR